MEDICGIGKAIGITFKGENHNMFSVLSQTKKVSKGPNVGIRGGGWRFSWGRKVGWSGWCGGLRGGCVR